MPKSNDSNATKEDIKVLRRDLGLLRDGLKEDINRSEEKIEVRMSKKFESYRDDVLTKFDAVMKELEEMREDSSLGVYQTNQLREEVDSHEKRIIKLEAA
ncbi:MAG: hypothetical protein ACD_37C00603G0011 [uncultured bacterium]|nr:MAG: hypothetical protein ACD_37C00603G0011 [uncultured bacterium]